MNQLMRKATGTTTAMTPRTLPTTTPAVAPACVSDEVGEEPRAEFEVVGCVGELEGDDEVGVEENSEPEGDAVEVLEVEWGRVDGEMRMNEGECKGDVCSGDDRLGVERMGV